MKTKKTKFTFTKLTFPEIYDKLNSRNWVIVHLKESMKAKLFDTNTKILYHIPDGYIEYDKERYYRKY